MSKRLYVGNLPFTVGELQVREHFEQVAPVLNVSIITDKDTGRPRGFAFVEMDDDGAQRAIEQLDGVDFGGRRLTVNEAKPRERTNGYRPREDTRVDRSGKRDRW